MTELLLITQVFFVCAMTVFVLSNMKSRGEKKNVLKQHAEEKLEELRALRHVHLAMPLSEKTRPSAMGEIVGQEEGIRALTAALCGKNPQHILIYGPPGVGKTCAARLALEMAKQSPGTPFAPDAKFIEMDATCIRFDERSIADPLIGSVHDPIYQGAGAYGQAGLPQPKPGAVTKANGGVLFLDEIGELHPVQLNKLLKVMEDRKVFFESAYYSKADKNIPEYIHQIFQRGMPADFRLIGATTRQPSEIPPALRSRVVEVFFRPLDPEELTYIAANGAKKGGLPIDKEALQLIAEYSENGRDAVNMVQMAVGLAEAGDKRFIEKGDVRFIIENGRYSRRYLPKAKPGSRIGCVYGLAVAGPSQGILLEIEAVAKKAASGEGSWRVTGFAEREEMEGGGKRLGRQSAAMASMESVATMLEACAGIRVREYDLHIHVSGGMMVDGPSAGVAIAVCLYSAIHGIPVPGETAFTGEMGLRGEIRPVGGVREKLEAAKKAGVRTAYIPADNAGEYTGELRAVPVSHFSQVLEALFGETIRQGA